MTTAESVAGILRSGVHREMTQTLMHPVLAQSLDKVAGNWSLNVFHRHLYEPFQRARQLNPYLTFREFINSGRLNKYVLEAMVGPDGYILITQHSGTAYFEAWARTLASPPARDAPIPHWLSWDHWGSQRVDIDLTGKPRVVPINFPVGRRVSGVTQWVYPEWNIGRPRLFQALAYIELIRRLPPGTQIPLSGGAPDLLRALALPHNPLPTPFTGVGGLQMSNLQLARMLQTGQSPVSRAVLLPAGHPPPPGFAASAAGRGGRASTDARFELASRFGDPNLVGARYFDQNINSYPKAGNASRPPAALTNSTDPVTMLSEAELVEMGRWNPGCLEIGYETFQVEHRLGQRSVDQIQNMVTVLEPAVDASLIAHLCGLCDPHNLVILTPQGHAAVDFYAYYVQSFGQWVPTSRAVPPLHAKPSDHPDFARAMNVFVAFSPYHLEPVAHMLRDLKVMQAVQVAKPEIVDAYNVLAGNIGAAMRSYQMDPSLIPMQLVNGDWK